MIDVGIVVPTLGVRDKWLEQCLNSIRRAGSAHICIVAPRHVDVADLVSRELCDSTCVDQNNGLASAINAAFLSLPPEVTMMNWLGDDDQLEPNSIRRFRECLMSSSATFVYGKCRIIDVHGNEVGMNSSGTWATRLMKYGPDLVPQPGALFRRDAFDQIGGLDTRLGWAFDHDLFIRLNEVGRGIYLPEVGASYRWHSETLSAGKRWKSVMEASRVRRSHLPHHLRVFSCIWEWPVMVATFVAGKWPNLSSPLLAILGRRTSSAK